MSQQTAEDDRTRLAINTIKTLAIDAVEQARSGHPGLPMGAADYAFHLWTRHLRFDPGDPAWPDRDRFVLSAGHGSMLLYALLHLSGFDLPLEELKRFRQWESMTPGHPEYGCAPGTYFVAFLVLRKSWKVQAGTALGLLVAHWLLFQFVGAPGVTGPWMRDANIGTYLDQLILGKNWSGAYVTINCVSSAANTIFGVMVGKLMMSALPSARKVLVLAATGVGGILLGLALSPAIPLVKRIWTPSFTFYCAGFTLLAFLLFYWVCNIQFMRRWAKVFIIVGANSIFIYILNQILGGWMDQKALALTGWAFDDGNPWGGFLNAWIVLLFNIYLCYWLYRRKIFLKI